MRSRFVIALVAILACATVAFAQAPVPPAWRVARARLDAEHAARIEELAVRCDQLKRPDEAAKARAWIIHRDSGRQYVFLLPEADPVQPKPDAPEVVKYWHKRLLEIRKTYAAGLFDIARQAIEAGNLPAGWQLVYETLREDPDHAAARRALGFVGTAGKWTRGKPIGTNKPGTPYANAKVGWRSGSYWRVESEHFSAVTNVSANAGQELVRELEDLYAAWEQLFASYWGTKVELAAKLSGQASRVAPKLRKVVLFKSKEEYIAALLQVQPQIAITDGLYLDTDSTVYLFAGEERAKATWRHEATHQLFHEARRVLPTIGANHNFWAIEGAAMYMESMVARPGFAMLGGLDASRLQFSRDNAMRGKFYVRQVQFVALGRKQIQEDENIRRLYSQGAGLAFFLMDFQDGRYRSAFGDYLNRIYASEDNAASLTECTGVGFAQLDQEYVAWLQVSDADLAKCPPLPTIRHLCLAQTRVTAAGIQRLPAFSELEWGDFSGLPLSDAEAARILVSPRLRQLSLEKTPIGDAFAPALAKLTSLDELDLSGTQITDEGLAPLAGLKQLKMLYLSGTKVSDASVLVLSSLKELETLELDGTAISPEGLAKLRKSLPKWKERP